MASHLHCEILLLGHVPRHTEVTVIVVQKVQVTSLSLEFSMNDVNIRLPLGPVNVWPGQFT